jgi:hypothetical protein
VQFKVGNEKLTLSTQGNVGDMEYEIEEKDFAETSKPVWGHNGTNVFATSFLKTCVKFIELTDGNAAKFTLFEGNPLLCEIVLAEHGSIFIALAPRVEEEENTFEE